MIDAAHVREDRVSSADALLAAVARISGVVEAGVAEAEAGAMLPEATAAALCSSGLLAMKLPAALGGSEADLVTQVHVIEALAAIDATAAWCAMIGASAIGWPGAFLVDEAANEIFRDGCVPQAAVVVQPTGIATVVDGGYRLSGEWTFASGIRHAEWVSAGARVQNGQADPRGHVMLTFPTACARIRDDWDVMGLQGTGSYGFAVNDLFVRKAFTWDFMHARPRRGGPLYQLGWPGFVAHEPAALALGIGRRVLDEMIALGRVKMTRRNAETQPGWQVFQHTIGKEEIRLRSARALLIEICERVWMAACRGTGPGPRLQAELRAVSAFATEIAYDLAGTAFRAGGGAAIHRSHVLQRCLRDIAAAGQHWLARGTAHEIYGRFLLGAPDASAVADAPAAS